MHEGRRLPSPALLDPALTLSSALGGQSTGALIDVRAKA